MTHVPTGRPGDRARRIELVAAIVFGRDPSDPTKAVSGWQSKLSLAMGMGRTAVNDTLKMEVSVSFDLRLWRCLLEYQLQRAKDDQLLTEIMLELSCKSGHEK